MGFQSVKFLTWAKSLSQPVWIATFASIGIHGVLFGAGPSFPSLSLASLDPGAQKDEQRTVPLVELTPEEQSQLPDFSSSAYSLFPGTDPNLLPLLPVPGSTDSPTQSRPLSPGDSLSSVNPPNPFGFGITPYTPSRRPNIVFPNRRVPLPSSITSSPNRNPTNAGKPQSGSTTTDNSSTVGNSPANSQSPASTPTTPQETPDEQHTGPTAADLVPEEQGGQGTSASEGGEEAPMTATRPEDGEESGAEAGSPSLQEQLAALAYNASGTSEGVAEQRRQDWLAAARQQSELPELAIAETLSVTIPYERQLCLNPEPVKGAVGVWVTPEGELGAEPTLIKSTGYPFLNQQALVGIAAMDFPAGDAIAAYEFEIRIDYDPETCVSRDRFIQAK